MLREEAVARLKALEGEDLVQLASRLGIPIWRGQKKNKGWAGHVLEAYLGLPKNASRRPNFGSWELKVVPLKRLKSGKIVPKETMAITMINPEEVKATPFEESHLLAKLRRILICARMFEGQHEPSSVLVRVAAFDLSDAKVYEQVKRDYQLVQQTIRDKGFDALTGRMGILVQPRTKGPGHGSTSRAFYARKQFVSLMLGVE